MPSLAADVEARIRVCVRERQPHRLGEVCRVERRIDAPCVHHQIDDDQREQRGSRRRRPLAAFVRPPTRGRRSRPRAAAPMTRHAAASATCMRPPRPDRATCRDRAKLEESEHRHGRQIHAGPGRDPPERADRQRKRDGDEPGARETRSRRAPSHRLPSCRGHSGDDDRPDRPCTSPETSETEAAAGGLGRTGRRAYTRRTRSTGWPRRRRSRTASSATGRGRPDRTVRGQQRHAEIDREQERFPSAVQESGATAWPRAIGGEVVAKQVQRHHLDERQRVQRPETLGHRRGRVPTAPPRDRAGRVESPRRPGRDQHRARPLPSAARAVPAAPQAACWQRPRTPDRRRASRAA